MTNERLRSKSWLNIQSSNTMMLAMHGIMVYFRFCDLGNQLYF